MMFKRFRKHKREFDVIEKMIEPLICIVLLIRASIEFTSGKGVLPIRGSGVLFHEEQPYLFLAIVSKIGYAIFSVAIFNIREKSGENYCFLLFGEVVFPPEKTKFFNILDTTLLIVGVIVGGGALVAADLIYYN